jgi:DNA gyrase subunit B
MSAEELRETTLDPARRRMLRVIVESEVETDGALNDLMGKDAQARYRFIMDSAANVAADDLDV